MKTLTLTLFCLLLTSFTAQAGPPPAAAIVPGGSVSPQGVFLLDGKPFRGIGVNYYTAFTRTLADPKDTSYRQGFKVLADHDIHFVRYNAGGYFPTDYKLYLDNREEWFRRMDGVVKAAEENHVGLIASLFWFHACIPDLMHEHVDQLGNPDSKTHAFMRQYIKEFATRYRNSPALWGYELGNEPNLLADLPNANEVPPPLDKAFGWPVKRTQRDELTQPMVERDLIDFATEVRKYDPQRLVTSGNSIPRPFAFHNSLYDAWIQDSRNDYLAIILRDNPDPLNSISIHLYYECDDQYFADQKVNLDGVVKTTMADSALVKKPLFIGELGAPRDLGIDKERTFHKRLIEAMVVNRVPLATFWDFDNGGLANEWNITATGERSYILDWISAANKQIKKQLKNERPGIWRRWFHLGCH